MVANIVSKAQSALEEWDPDEASEAEIAEVFHAIFGRAPDSDDDPVSDIYAAKDVLSAEDAKRLARVI